MKKKKATPKSSPKQRMKDSAASAQRQRLLAALREVGGAGLSTIQLREELDIMAPAPRIFELRHDYGYNVQLIWDRCRNAQGYEHACGRYILFPGKWRAAA